MKITFLGTRGYIDAKSRRHKWHTSTLISYRGKRVMIDCGIDWEKKVWKLKPDAIVITHAHPDHAWGLKNGAPCPVYAPYTTWQLIKDYPIKHQRLLKVRTPKKVCGITFETFPVIHSLLAPGVGYRITAGRTTVFCVHDLIKIKQQRPALKNVQLYIGDGASIMRPIIRRSKGKLVGHTTVRAQIGWCQKEGVPQAIFTHCGSQIVKGDERSLGALVRELGEERGVEASIAYDGLEVRV